MAGTQHPRSQNRTLLKFRLSRKAAGIGWNVAYPVEFFYHRLWKSWTSTACCINAWWSLRMLKNRNAMNSREKYNRVSGISSTIRMHHGDSGIPPAKSAGASRNDNTTEIQESFLALNSSPWCGQVKYIFLKQYIRRHDPEDIWHKDSADAFILILSVNCLVFFLLMAKILIPIL